MQITLVFTSLVLAVVVSAFPQSPESRAAILSQDTEVNFDGTYRNRFQTANGISQEEIGYLQPSRDGTPAAVVQGVSTYTAPDGSVISTSYTSGENGYQASGAHLPQSPPIPPAIARALAYIASQPSTPIPIQYQ